MQYRKLGRTNLNISLIGFGGLALSFQPSDIAIQAIHTALDEGVNYFDVDEGGNLPPNRAYLNGASKIGEVLKERRKDCHVGVKSMRQTYDELKEDVDLASERIVKGTKREVIDIFQLCFLDDPHKMEVILSKNGGLRALEEAKDEGKIDYILAAAHNPRTLIQAINSERFDVIELPFNIVEDEHLRMVIPLAKERGVGTIVMKPLAGGRLASLSDYSLRWVLSHDVTCAIPGMKNEEEVRENVKVGHAPKALDANEHEALKELGESIGKEYCHRCGYCLPCSQGIFIIGVMDLLKSPLLPLEQKRMAYTGLVAKLGGAASTCIGCTECVRRCPFDLPIPEFMSQAADIFERGVEPEKLRAT